MSFLDDEGFAALGEKSIEIRSDENMCMLSGSVNISTFSNEYSITNAYIALF